MDKILLTDCDGVLLDWEAKFETFARRLGYQFKDNYANTYSIGEQLGIGHEESHDLIAKFNHSSDFESIPPWRDSVEGIAKFKADGWKIIIITTAGLHPWTYGLRRSNLDNVFGVGAIDELYVLDMHGDKGEVLVNYNGSGLYWIEDKPSNAELAYKYGLKPLLMDNLHNSSYKGNVPRVNSWKEIYSIVTNDI
ncbi:5'(3')-deoxyribonucleotidase [uncultured Caudovirales phage]|uniref:5'(3')-deoxyribonucleotidase n=1 Tax=uncultured Caudovirales phage TaxID=2100421 RepID=A0A6J5TA64_9CAUD|nr:5'(3')-deoxyribonucleotidase [uncultured Caudovirales phage]